MEEPGTFFRGTLSVSIFSPEKRANEISSRPTMMIFPATVRGRWPSACRSYFLPSSLSCLSRPIYPLYLFSSIRLLDGHIFN